MSVEKILAMGETATYLITMVLLWLLMAAMIISPFAFVIYMMFFHGPEFSPVWAMGFPLLLIPFIALMEV